MRIKFSRVLIVLLSLITLTACSAKKSDSSGSAANMASHSVNSENDSSGKEKSSNSTVGTASQQKKQTGNLKIIQRCDMSVVTKDVNKLLKDIDNKLTEVNGYVENESVLQLNSTSVLRVPESKFQEFIKFVEKNYEVNNKQISTENITDAYVDNAARLNNLKAQEQQVLGILKRANTVDEVLKVQSELNKIRGDAEALEAKQKSWDKEVDYSTIIIRASGKEIIPDNKLKVISGSEFGKAVSKGFGNTGIAIILFFEYALIFILSNIVIILPLCIIGFVGYKKYKKYNKK